jgi:anaerobic ribonucleoside-triphosphate reductase
MDLPGRDMQEAVSCTQNSTEGVDVRLEDGERQRCEVWTRVMGYHRPVTSFNIGKRAEHAERKFFTECKAQVALG